MQSSGAADVVDGTRKTSSWRRFLPIVAIVIGAVAALILGREYLSFSALAENYQDLTAWRDQNWVFALGVFMIAYALAVAFSVPGAVWLTLIVGFLFGTLVGSIMVVIAATIGAISPPSL